MLTTTSAIHRLRSRSRELLLKITTKEHFLAEARGGAEADPQDDFQRALRRQKTNLLAGLVEVAGLIHAHGQGCHSKHQQRAEPAASGNRNVEEKIFHALPSPANQLAQSSSGAAQPPPDIGREQPLVDDRRRGKCAHANSRRAPSEQLLTFSTLKTASTRISAAVCQ